MDNTLKLLVKKEIFDKLASGEQSYIYFEPTKYWMKRVANDVKTNFEKLKETQDFRTFDSVRVSCGAEYAEYDLVGITAGCTPDDQNPNHQGIVINIKNKNEEEELIPEEMPANISNEFGLGRLDFISDNDDVENDDDEIADVDEQSPSTPDNDDETHETPPYVDDDASYEDVEKTLFEIIDIIGGFEKAYVVNSPKVIIFSNGKIYGLNKKVSINNDSEVIVKMETENVYKKEDETNNDFIDRISNILCGYERASHLFIYKNGCGLVNDESGVYFRMKLKKMRFRR